MGASGMVCERMRCLHLCEFRAPFCRAVETELVFIFIVPQKSYFAEELRDTDGDRGAGPGLLVDGCAMATDSNGAIYVAGTINGLPTFEGSPLPNLYTAFVASWDAAGNRRFLNLLGGADGPTEAMAVARLGTDELLVLGYTRATLHSGGAGAGYGDVFLARYTSQGASRGITRFGGRDEDIPNGMIVTDGRVWTSWRTTAGVAGTLLEQVLVSLDGDGRIAARRALSTDAFVVETLHANPPFAGCLVGGTRIGADLAYRLECLDTQLETRWSATGGGGGSSFSTDRLICAADVCLLVGSTVGDLDGERVPGELDGAAILLTPEGRRWTRLFGAPGALTRATAGMLGSGSTVVFGWSNGAIAGQAPAGRIDGWAQRMP